MANNNDSIKKTIFVVVALCLVCSLIVSFAAVELRPIQNKNKALDRQSNILEAAGLLAEAKGDIPGTYHKYIEAKVIDLKTGQIIPGLDGDKFDMHKAANDPSENMALSQEQDVASIKKRSNRANVYFVHDKQGQLTRVIVPIHGYGLWSTMYAFLAVKPDGNTVASLVYYDQGETPGLGAKVASDKWKALWPGKKLYKDGEPAIRIVKGGAQKGNPYQVDALSGATLTSNGVQHTLTFWLGDLGYGPFLKNLRNGALSNG